MRRLGRFGRRYAAAVRLTTFVPIAAFGVLTTWTCAYAWLLIRGRSTEDDLTVLATAQSWARVTVVGDADLVSVSVVADCGETDIPRSANPDVAIAAGVRR